MTDERTSLRLQVLESLGAPLVLAVEDVMARGGAASDRAMAEQVAVLLGGAVQASIALGESLKLRAGGDPEQVALAALGARFVAGFYRAQNGRVPGAAEIGRFAAAADAVLAFADNFAASAEARTRLRMLDGQDGAALPDETQIALQFVAAVIPVVEAVTAFSFGRVEKKLVQEVVDRLCRDAEDLCRDIAGDEVTGPQARWTELACLRMLAGIYAACHRNETATLVQLGHAEREKMAVNGLIPMEPLWEAYGLRLAMLSVLGAAGWAQGEARSSARAPQAADPADFYYQSAPAAPPPPAQAASAGPVNPLSFFAKKQDSQTEGA